jgi:uncharacterized protein with von Willebrand factor type A (vWA) domain
MKCTLISENATYKKENDIMNTTTKGKRFEDILNDLLNGTSQRIMDQEIENTLSEMMQEIQSNGDMVTGYSKVEECPCGCGSVQITVEYTAYNFTPFGMEVTEGKAETIVTVKRG